MKSILVPTDFSPISKNALAYAVNLAENLDAQITLLHAYHTFSININPSLLIKEYKEDVELFKRVSEIQLKAFCEEIKNTTSCQCGYVNYQGLAKDVIVEYANKTKPDLLIIGTENLMPIERIVYGTVTGKIIKEVDCSIMVIPEDVKYTTPKKIAFAMDYHDSDIDEVLFIENLSKKFNSKTLIVHVMKDTEDVLFEENYFMNTQVEIKKRISKNKTTFNLINGNNITEELEKYVTDESIDILAVAKTKKTFLERLFSGSVSQKLFYHINMPLLIFEAKDIPEDII